MTSKNHYHQRPIRRILVVNRGEIAIRILQACRELPQESRPTTYAMYTDKDSTHVSLGRPDHAFQAPSASAYMDIDYLVKVVKSHQIDGVHPGYGFLSESPEFSRRMWQEANCLVVGPGWEILDRTGNKLKAKALAAECDVPVLKAMASPSSSVDDVRRFVHADGGGVGYPVMIKAVDGGGGRGIRLVKSEDALQNAVERCIGESPSKTVFAEQAAVNGFKHIEIQIIGDGSGNARHLWERDCSVQRRFQKIVEIAPTPVDDRTTIAEVIRAALRMAKKIHYLGLGTFEFLVNPRRKEFFFLEINPRLQVEHTITESICGVDLVKEQLLLAQGLVRESSISFADEKEALGVPPKFSIQLRLCAEDPDANFSLSIGKVANAIFPSGNGIRVDSHLSQGGVVGPDFDNLMAKIIVTASSWAEVVSKSQRALADTIIGGVKTNLNLLCAIVADKDFQSGQADTEWLEKNLNNLVQVGQRIGQEATRHTSSLPSPLTGAVSSSSSSPSSSSSSTTANTGAVTTFRKGDAWSLKLDPIGSSTDSTSALSGEHHLKIDKITRNEFPESLVAEISYTSSGHRPQPYKISLKSTSASSQATSSQHRRGDPNDRTHIVLPMGGKLIEVLVEEGDDVKENQVVGFIKQMKMELEIRSPRAGRVKWVIELENDEDGGGDDVTEGTLLAELEAEGEVKQENKSSLEVKSRL